MSSQAAQMADNNQPPRLLCLPFEIRQMILRYLTLPIPYRGWTIHSLAKTCRQLQVEVYDACIPRSISTREAMMRVYTKPRGNVVEFQVRRAVWTIAAVADPINAMLLDRVNPLGQLTVAIVDPATRHFCQTPWEKFLNIFARAITIAWMAERVKSLRCFCLAVYSRDEGENGTSQTLDYFWSQTVDLPGHPAHGLLYNDVILMLFSNVGAVEDFWVCTWIGDRARRNMYIRSDYGIESLDEIAEWMEHAGMCDDCRRRRPRSGSCRWMWAMRPIVSNAIHRLQKAVQRLVDDLPTLLATSRPEVRMAAQGWIPTDWRVNVTE